MKTFVTSYHAGVSTYTSYIRASNLARAQKLVVLRGLGERIDGTNDKTRRVCASRLFEQRRYKDLIHWLCFAGNVLCNAGLWKRDLLLSDDGLIHRTVHLMDAPRHRRYKKYFEKERIAVGIMLKVFDERTAKVGF